jgi:hypothetical protein
MRVNIARASKGVCGAFFEHHIRSFADEYDFPNIKSAASYVKTGRQGLQSYVDYLIDIGYKAELYCLYPNKDLFQDVGDNWQIVSRTSPSYGFVIPNDDPLLVEFKLKYG